MNRYSGIVAFYGPITEDNPTKGLYVTYDVTKEEEKRGAENKKMEGEPYTHLSGPDVGSWEAIREWMSKPVRKQTKNYSYFTIMSPCFSAPPEYIFDKLLEVLRKI